MDGKKPGWLVEDRHGLGSVPLDPNPRPSLGSPTYRYLESVTTDPDALLRLIYAYSAGQGPGPDEEAFVVIGDLLREAVVPPKLSAALYRAAAKIPGVVVLPDAVDALGRHGVAVSYRGSARDLAGPSAAPNAGQRMGAREWIFDKRTLEYLGENDVVLVDSTFGKAGDVVGCAAVIRRSVVDKPGQVPGR